MTQEQHDLLWMLAKGEKLPADAGALYLAIEAKINAPAPLRPMSDAPRDGRKLIAYALDGNPVIVWANHGEEAVWTHSDGTIAPKWLLGYLPLPEVELCARAAIAAAKEGE